MNNDQKEIEAENRAGTSEAAASDINEEYETPLSKKSFTPMDIYDQTIGSRKGSVRANVIFSALSIVLGIYIFLYHQRYIGLCFFIAGALMLIYTVVKDKKLHRCLMTLDYHVTSDSCKRRDVDKGGSDDPDRITYVFEKYGSAPQHIRDLTVGSDYYLIIDNRTNDLICVVKAFRAQPDPNSFVECDGVFYPRKGILLTKEEIKERKISSAAKAKNASKQKSIPTLKEISPSFVKAEKSNHMRPRTEAEFKGDDEILYYSRSVSDNRKSIFLRLSEQEQASYCNAYNTNEKSMKAADTFMVMSIVGYVLLACSYFYYPIAYLYLLFSPLVLAIPFIRAAIGAKRSTRAVRSVRADIPYLSREIRDGQSKIIGKVGLISGSNILAWMISFIAGAYLA